MATPLGLRTAVVFKDVPANTEKSFTTYQHGSILYAEVTNKTASAVDFIVNDNPEGGRAGVAIPIEANSTRAIPIQLYKFKATGVVTVVAYGQ